MEILDNTILSSELNNTILQLLNRIWISKQNSVLIYPDNEIFLSLIVDCVHNLETNLHFKKDPIKRTSVLIISRNRNLLKKISEFTIGTEELYEYCNTYHDFLNKKGIFCDMNDRTFSMLYWRTYLSKYYENDIPNVIPMYYIFPIASGRKRFIPVSRGNLNKLGKKDNLQPPTFIFTDTLKTLESNKEKIDLIFVDGTTIKGHIDILEYQKIPFLIFLDNPLDIRIPYLLKGKNKNYILDTFEFKNLVKSSDLNKKIELPSVDVDNIVFKYIKSSFEGVLEQSFELLNNLYKVNFNRNDLKIIRTLLYNTVRMTIEGVEYDFIATFDSKYTSIKELIKELKDSDFRYDNLDFEKIIELIEDIYNKYQLDTISPKYKELERIISESINKNKNVLVIASGKIDSLGLKEKISLNLQMEITDLEDGGIYIKSYQDVKNIQGVIYDLVILTSAIRISDLQPILKKLGKKMIVLLYQLEIKELKTKFKLLSKAKNEFSFFINETLYQRLYKKITRIDVEKQRELKVEIGNLFESIDSLKFDYSNRLTKPYLSENSVRVKLITFTDNTKVFLRPGNAVRCLVKRKKSIKKEHIKNLKGDEEILIINSDIKKDLYEVFIENLSEKDSTKQHYQNIQEWRRIYEDKFIFHKLNDDKLFKRMFFLGWDKKTSGILKNWRSGYSFGPRDLEDIKILGKALNIESFIKNAEYYYNSMEYIRIERRVTARLLNKIIYLSKNDIDSTESAFLENYNLTLEEIQEAIEIKQISSISDRLYKVKSSEVGCIFE